MARLSDVEQMSSRPNEDSTYRPFDQDRLGDPPWSRTDPRVMAWERAHGHDVRLKCLPEFGCQAVIDRAERIEDAAREVVRILGDRSRSVKQLREALDG